MTLVCLKCHCDICVVLCGFTIIGTALKATDILFFYLKKL